MFFVFSTRRHPAQPVSASQDEESAARRLLEAPEVCLISTAIIISFLLYQPFLNRSQPCFWDKLANFQVVCPQNGTAVLKGDEHHARVDGAEAGQRPRCARVQTLRRKSTSIPERLCCEPRSPSLWWSGGTAIRVRCSTVRTTHCSSRYGNHCATTGTFFPLRTYSSSDTSLSIVLRHLHRSEWF